MSIEVSNDIYTLQEPAFTEEVVEESVGAQREAEEVEKDNIQLKS